MRRRCLAIFGAFPPFGGPGALRAVKLLKYLPENGWQVDVVAPRGRAGWFADAALEDELGHTRVYRAGVTAPWTGAIETARRLGKNPHRSSVVVSALRGVMRAARAVRDVAAIPDEFVGFSTAALFRARALLRSRSYDLLYTSSMPYSTHLAGLALRAAGGPRWLVEMRDPWAGHRFRGQQWVWRSTFDAACERRVLRAASRVVVVTPGMRRLIGERYGDPITDKLRLVTNGYDSSDFVSGVIGSESEQLRLLFVGTITAQLTPIRTLLEAIDLLVDRDPGVRKRLQIRILGGVDLQCSGELRDWSARQTGAEMIVVDEFVTHKEATRAMQLADGLLLTIANEGHWILTSKVFEYLGSGTPIIGLVPDGDCRQLLERTGGATLVRPGHAAELASVIEEALTNNGVRPVIRRDADAVSAYSYERIAAQVAAVMTEASALSD